MRTFDQILGLPKIFIFGEAVVMTTIDDEYITDIPIDGPGIDILADNGWGDEGQEGENAATENTAVWCEQCGIHNIGDCFIHGGNMTVTPDNAMPTRACLSLPKILALKRVRDSEPCSLEAKRGIFSKKFMKLRTLFGPMEAKRTTTKPKLQTGMMEYQISGESKCEYLDTSDENSCNWMMFVRPANVFAQQNMAAFQEKGNIYFVTCKNIPKGTELRVWYAAAYAKAIGKRILLPDPTDKKQAIADVRKEKKSLQEQPYSNITPSVESNSESVEDPPENCNVKSPTSDNKTKGAVRNDKSTIATSAPPEKRKRSARAMKDSPVLFACNTCNTAFRKLGQLDLHICKELGEGEDDSSGCVTRRRKGKPRKLLDNEDNSSASKAANVDFCSPEICLDISSSNLPHSDIMSHLNEEEISTGEKLYSNTDTGMTLLPSTALIPTTTIEFSGDDSENQLSSTNKRAPGRPKGSKNKGRVFTKAKLHLKSVSKRHIYICQYCEKPFTNNELYVIHEASHTNSLPYICTYPGCGKSFTSKFKHQRHLDVHMKPNNFPCKFCNSTFNRVDHLKNHLLVHDSNRSIFTCAVCGKSYLYKTNLTFHMAKHEVEEGETLRCLVCNTKFESKESLRAHVNTHNRYKKEGERMRTHSCSQCHKLFSTAKDIKRHMVTHSKERHFLCEHCPQTFVRKDHLRRHYTSNHKKEFYESQLKDSPYGCSMCLLVFKQNDFLDYHMKSIHPDGMKVEPKTRREKSGRLSGKLSAGSDSNDGNPPPCAARVSKDSQNQLVKLLQKQPVPKPDTPLQQLVQFTPTPQQPLSALRQQLETLPLNAMKVQQGNNQTTNPRPYAIVYPASMQPTASQAPMYDSSEIIVESFPAPPTKTIPFRFQNQLVSQPQLQTQNPSQIHQLQQESQQQDLQHQIQQDQQSLLNQIQMQQFQQQQLQQQIQQQPLAPMVQGMQVDILNSLNGLNQVQDLQTNSNTNFLNIINLGGHNFLVRPGQVLDFNKPVQLTVIKDPQLDNKLPPQQHVQPHMQHLGGKSESNSLVYSNQQVLQGNICKPDHCYASATLANPTLSHLLNSQNKSQLSVLDKSNSVQGSGVTDAEATQIIEQIKNAGPSVVPDSNLPDNMQVHNEHLVSHQQQHLQQLHQDHPFQQQENQHQEQQQQPLQNLSNFTLAWSDSLQDYSSIAELPASTDVTSINHGDGLGAVVSGSMPANWVLQLPGTMLDQPQVQQLQSHHLTDSDVMSVTSCPVNDS